MGVLVTGSSGFLGLSLVRTLATQLKASPTTKFKTLNLLVRPTAQHSARERFDDIVARSGLAPDLCDVRLVEGDLSDVREWLPRLDRPIHTLVNIAGTVRFDQPTAEIYKNNCTDVVDMMKQLCERYQTELKTIIHYSTAYVQSIPETYQRPVPSGPLGDPARYLESEFANSYVYSKRWAEYTIAREIARPSLTLNIVRPSQITVGWDGWSSNIAVLPFLLYTLRKRKLNYLLMNPNYATNLTPCDMVTNTTLALLLEGDKVAKAIEQAAVEKAVDGVLPSDSLVRYFNIVPPADQNILFKEIMSEIATTNGQPWELGCNKSDERVNKAVAAYGQYFLHPYKFNTDSMELLNTASDFDIWKSHTEDFKRAYIPVVRNHIYQHEHDEQCTRSSLN